MPNSSQLETKIESCAPSQKFLHHFFTLSQETKEHILSLTPKFGFGSFSAAVFYRTYSREKADGAQESWNDVVIRCIEGAISIRKDFYVKQHLHWNDSEWQTYAKNMALSMFDMKWMPPGRGLWCCGTDYVSQRGSAALNNCGSVDTKNFSKSLQWVAEALMVGCGVGIAIFNDEWNDVVQKPNKEEWEYFDIPDTKEGWAASMAALVDAYVQKNGKVRKFPHFRYHLIRGKGEKIKSFGGISSGPGPLIKMHKKMEVYFDTYVDFQNAQSDQDKEQCFANLVTRLRPEDYDYMDDKTFNEFVETVRKSFRDNPTLKKYDKVRLLADNFNVCGCTVIAGNVRRSAEILIGSPYDDTFINLKNYILNPERECLGWMSNNTVRLTKSEDFLLIPKLAELIKVNGEPGILNLINIHRYGRIGHYHNPTEPWTREFEEDPATLVNPCVTADTKVLTSQGWLSVHELINTPFKAIINGKEYNSSGFWKTGVKPIFRLNLNNGLSLKCTGDHKIYTKNGPIELQNLTSFDDIIIPNNSSYKWPVSFDITKLPERYFKYSEAEKDQLKCLQYGINTIIKKHDNYLSDDIPYYYLVIMPQTTDQYSSSITFIEKLGEAAVYDCNVNDIHQFNANGILVHNCGESNLEPFELCNLSEVFPPRCMKSTVSVNDEELMQAFRYATFYSSTVSLLPTQWEDTNAVVARNRRIGVSMSGIAALVSTVGSAELIRICRAAYKVIRDENTRLAREAGVPASIRVTVIKPSGSISQLAGVSAGQHSPAFRYARRRIRIAEHSSMIPILREAGHHIEKDVYSDNTLIAEFPIDQSKTKSAEEVSFAEQFTLLTTLQREFADNSVSATLYFNPETEGDKIADEIAQNAPNLKTCSVLPHCKKGVYKQMPYEGITKEQYLEMVSKLKPIDWSKFGQSNGEMPRYCDGDKCVL